MDNVTHSLAGLLLAESALQLRARRRGVEPGRADSAGGTARFGAVARIASMLAANLPDADLFYTGAGGDPLRYMLHHRGYTHTVILAVVGAALLCGAALGILRGRARAGTAGPSRADARWLFGILLVSALSHLVLDWTNSYGLHPFWPVDDRWRYGDAVFIVEPWLWVVAVPTLVAATAHRVARGLLSLVLVVGLGLAWRVPLVSQGAAVALTVGAVAAIVLARALRPGVRVTAAVAAWVAVTLVMAAGTAAARGAAVRAVHDADPTAELLDVVVSPLPANAVCTNVLTVERSGGTYRVTTARVSAAPAVTAAAGCGAGTTEGPTFRPSSRRSTPAVQWDREWTAPGAELAALARESCPARAALRFLRVPVWQMAGDADVRLGDARYGGTSGGLSSLALPRQSSVCPAAIPPWTPPRADLLGPGQGSP